MTIRRLVFNVLKNNKSNSFKLHPLYFNHVRLVATEELNESTELSIRDKFYFHRPSVKKWKRPPFVKNLFLGKLDTMLLAFPEILNQEQLENVEKVVSAINNFYGEKVNSFKIDEDQKVPAEVLQELKDMGLFGRFVPTEYGGLGLTYTEYTRLNEAIGLNWSIGSILGIHEYATQALIMVGTEAQKRKFLPDLASGKKTATLCHFESKSGGDSGMCDTTAVLTSDCSSYILNGTKTWVTNASESDVFLVYASLPRKFELEDTKYIFLLVDKDTHGVSISPMTDSTSLCGANVCTVTFNEVIVPVDRLLLSQDSGLLILNKLHEYGRFAMASLTIGVLKTFLDQVTDFVINAERCKQSLADFPLIRYKLSKVATTIYKMESIAYFTAAIYDSSYDPDCSLESAIMKIYNSEGTLFCLQELKKIIGPLSLSKTQQIERFYRDAQGLAIFESSNDIARLFIGLTGFQYFGAKTAEYIEKIRNPFHFPWIKIKQHFQVGRLISERFKYDQDIAGHLHPSLTAHGNYLEECVQLLKMGMEKTLQIHGHDVMQCQLDAARVANMAIDIYVFTAVMSRSSRSYCIGLRNSDAEVKISYTVAGETLKRIQRYFDDILEGEYNNNDGKHLRVGMQVVDLRGYYPEHPLKHNF